MKNISSHELVVAHIEIEGMPHDALEVSALEGTETISKLFEIQVTAVSVGIVDAERLLGAKASLVLLRDDHEVCRMFGMIAAVRDGYESESDHTSYSFTFVPRAHRMALHETLDIFLDLTVPEIVEKKLELAKLEKGKDYELRLYNTYPKREMVVQYKETDLAFISRLTEHLGMSFFFEHRDGRDVFILTDDNPGFRRIAAEDHIPFRPRGDLRDVYRFESLAQMVPSEHIVRDYNYRTPHVELAARADLPGGEGRVVEYGAHFKTNDEGEKIAKIRAEEQIVRRRTICGESDVPLLAAGATFVLEGHPMGDLDLLITEVTHSLRQVALGAVSGARRYENKFKAILRSTKFRPARVTPKPKVHGVLTGRIDTETMGRYAEIDSEGRYHVKFLFDMAETPNGQASRPVRMMQPHAGAGYGMHFPLRHGVEVLILCVDGDPDRPIIAGTVPNPQTASPVVTGNAPRNIIRTGGDNEINIDDTADGQRIKLLTPRRNTTFQLGAPNDPIDGVSVKTEGHVATSSVEGTSQWTSFGMRMTALIDMLRTSLSLNVASRPSLLGILPQVDAMAGAVVNSGFPGLQELYGRNNSWIKQAQQDVYAEESKLNEVAVQSSQKAKGAQEACNACRAQAKASLPSPVSKEVREAIEQYEAAVAACDAGYLTALGTQEDRNGIVDVNRGNFFNATFEPVMNRDAYTEVAKYDYAQFEGYKTAEDEARWNLFNKEQKDAILAQSPNLTEEQAKARWLEGEKAKWDTATIPDGQQEYWESKFPPVDSAAVQAQAEANTSQIPAAVWADAGISPSRAGKPWNELTQDEKDALVYAWTKAQQDAQPKPDLKALRNMRKNDLLALLATKPEYAAYKAALETCGAKCSSELDAARLKAMNDNEAFAKKMKESSIELQRLADLSNKNDAVTVGIASTALNAALMVASQFEAWFARRAHKARWAAVSASATASAGAPESLDVSETTAQVLVDIGKYLGPLMNMHSLNVLGSDESTEVYGQNDMVLWSKTALLLGMGSSPRFTSKAAKIAARAAGVVGVPLPSDPPNPDEGKVIVMGMEAVHILSKKDLRVQADNDMTFVTRKTATLIAKEQGPDGTSSRMDMGLTDMSMKVLQSPKSVKASLEMKVSGGKGSVSLEATPAFQLELDENKKTAKLHASRHNKLELDGTAATARLRSHQWELKLEKGNDKGVTLGDPASYVKIQRDKVNVGNAGKELTLAGDLATLGTFQKVTVAGTNEIKLASAKVVFGGAVIDSANLMVKGEFEPQIARLSAESTLVAKAAIAAAKKAEVALEAAVNAQRTADEAAEAAEAAHRALNAT